MVKVKLTNRLKDLVIEAAEYVENGDPWKDVMDDYDVAELICFTARVIEQGVSG